MSSETILRIIHPSISYTTCPHQGHRWAGVFRSWNLARGDVHPALAASQSQGIIRFHVHTHTYSRVGSINEYIFKPKLKPLIDW